MTTSEIRVPRGCILAVSLLIVSFGSMSVAARSVLVENEASQEDDRSIDQLISEIHAERSMDRQNAKRGLVKLGVQAIEPLQQSILEANQDEQIRAMAVLNALALSNDEAISKAARQSMVSLANSNNDSAARISGKILRRLGRRMEQTAVSDLRSHGAEVDGGGATSTRQNFYTVHVGRQWTGTVDHLRRLQWLENPTTVNLIGKQIDDEVILAISKHPKITTLRIKDASITNESVSYLADMKRLDRLQFFYCSLDDACIESLLKLDQLTVLGLCGTNISEKSAERLKDHFGLALDYRFGAFLGVNYNRESEPVVLTQVVSGSSAQKAGVRVGDILVSYEDKPINVWRDFLGTVSRNYPGDQVQIVVRRDGRELKKTVILGRFTDQDVRRTR